MESCHSDRNVVLLFNISTVDFVRESDTDLNVDTLDCTCIRAFL